jgi:hypothetical protein
LDYDGRFVDSSPLLQRLTHSVIVSQHSSSNLLSGVLKFSETMRFLASHRFQAIAMKIDAQSFRCVDVICLGFEIAF